MNAEHPLGKLIRLPLKLIPKNAVMPILTREHWGMKWIAGSGPQGCWLGVAEREKRKLVSQALKGCSVFYDLGANVGYYSLMGAHQLGKSGKVFAFEPSQRNLDFLNQHLLINGISNVEVVKAAVSSESGQLAFDDEGDPVGFRLSTEGKAFVPVISLDEFVYQKKNPLPDVIKIDTEGEEFKILQGARRLIEEKKPIIFIETHNRFVPDVHEQCLEFLKKLSYRCHEYDGQPPTEIMATAK